MPLTYSLHPPVLAYFLNLVVNCTTGAFVVWHVAAPEFVATAFVRFVSVAEPEVAGLSCYDLQMGQDVCGVLVQTSSGVRHHVHNYGFASFILGWALDSALAYLVYWPSADID